MSLKEVIVGRVLRTLLGDQFQDRLSDLDPWEWEDVANMTEHFLMNGNCITGRRSFSSVLNPSYGLDS